MSLPSNNKCMKILWWVAFCIDTNFQLLGIFVCVHLPAGHLNMGRQTYWFQTRKIEIKDKLFPVFEWRWNAYKFAMTLKKSWISDTIYSAFTNRKSLPAGYLSLKNTYTGFVRKERSSPLQRHMHNLKSIENPLSSNSRGLHPQTIQSTASREGWDGDWWHSASEETRGGVWFVPPPLHLLLPGCSFARRVKAPLRTHHDHIPTQTGHSWSETGWKDHRSYRKYQYFQVVTTGSL